MILQTSFLLMAIGWGDITPGDVQPAVEPPVKAKVFGTRKFRHGSRITCAAFSPDDRFLAAGGGNDPVRLWDVATGNEVRQIPAKWVNAMLFSPRGTFLVTANTFNSIALWDTTTGRQLVELKGHETAIHTMILSPDATMMATGDRAGTIIIWELFLTARELTRLEGHSGEINALAFSPDSSKLVSASNDGTIRHWDTKRLKHVRTLDGRCNVTALAFLSNDKLASAGDDHQIRLWHLESGKEVGHWKGHEDAIVSLRTIDDREKLISSGRQSVRLWKVATGKQLRSIDRAWGDSDALALSNDGKSLMTAGLNNTLRQWDLSTGREVLSGDGHRSPVMGVAASPNGRLLASASRLGHIRIWDRSTAKTVKQWQAPALGSLQVGFSPDSQKLTTVHGAKGVLLWSTDAGKQIDHLSTPGESVATCTVFSPDGKQLAVGYEDSTVRIWRLSAKAKLMRSFATNSVVRAIDFSSDGGTLAATGGPEIYL